MSEKYGNDRYWCFIEDDWHKEVAVWKDDNNNPYVIARAIDKYEAKLIVDALLAFQNNTTGTLLLNKKSLAFLEFVKSNCPEPYATMASNAILWNDQEVYKKLLSDFPVVYS